MLNDLDDSQLDAMWDEVAADFKRLTIEYDYVMSEYKDVEEDVPVHVARDFKNKIDYMIGSLEVLRRECFDDEV